MRIAITGATGFLGGHVVAALQSSGVKIRALVRDQSRAIDLHQHFGDVLSHPQRRHTGASRYPSTNQSTPEWEDGCQSKSAMTNRKGSKQTGIALANGIELVIGDLDNTKALQQLVKDCDCVIHIAGAIKARTAAQLNAINGGGTANLVTACQHNNPNIRFVHISSIAAREPQLSSYANSKYLSETAANQHKGPVVIIRPNAVYGPGDRETLQVFQVAKGWLHPLLGGPDARIAMIHGQDAAEAIGAMCASNAPVGVFEISDASTQGYSWQQISRTAVAAVGANYRPIRIPSSLLLLAGGVSQALGKFRRDPPIFNRAKVREILHADWSVHPNRQIPTQFWTPQIDLESGFKQTVAWYQGQGWLK